MKNSGKIMGMLLLIFIAGNSDLNAQRGMRGSMDTTRMNRSGMNSMPMMGMRHSTDSMGMGNMMRGNDSLMMRRGMGNRQMNGMGPSARLGMRGMGNRQMNGMGPSARFGMRGMGRGPMYGMGPSARLGMRGMGRGPMYGMGPSARLGMRGMGSGRIIPENIPNLTDKQKKDIADIRMKIQDEMTKSRDEMMAKIQTMREANRKKILDILTPDQKKYLDSNNSINTSTSPEKTK